MDVPQIGPREQPGSPETFRASSFSSIYSLHPFVTSDNSGGSPPLSPVSVEAIIRDSEEGEGLQWMRRGILLSTLERYRISFLGSPRQPFDPRELVWTSALGRGGEAIMKKFTTL